MKDINAVAPTSLSHLIGNEKVTRKVRVAIDAAFEDSRRFDHSLLVGPPGMGKSTLASVIAHEMAVPFHEYLGQKLRTPADLNNVLLAAEPKAIVHIDEIHEASTSIQTALYMALDKRQIQCRGSNTIQTIPINDFTLLASTTEEHDLLQPFRDRMRLTLRFQFLSDDELAQVLSVRTRSLGWDIDDSALPLIAVRSRGTPRIALNLLQAARRVARSRGEDVITSATLRDAFDMEEVDSLGLTVLEQRYLRLLVDGPRRVNVLATALGVPTKTLTAVTEKFLIRAGLVDKDDQSRRVLTSKGHEHVRAGCFDPE